MSINTIMSNALSGLYASQTGIQTTSDNVANVNTPGYARKQLNLSAQYLAGLSAGVKIEGIERITDGFLVAASLRARSDAAGASRTSEFMTRLQAGFGDPTSGTDLFSKLSRSLDSFGAATLSPSSSVERRAGLGDLQVYLDDLKRIGGDIQTLRSEADTRLTSAVDRTNSILEEIDRLNDQIRVAGTSGGDTSGSQNALYQRLDELSQLMDIRTVPKQAGTVEVRTQDGVLLVGERASRIEYMSPGAANPGRLFPRMAITVPGSTVEYPLERHINTGELRALADLRDSDLVAMSRQVGQFAATSADAMNRTHNAHAAFPPANTLDGRVTGLMGTDALRFTGETTFSVTDDQGVVQRRIDVDFDAGTYSVNGGAAVAFGGTINGFVAAMNTAFGGDATMAFSAQGKMTVTGAAGFGIAIGDNPDNPSARAGRGFSHFFGLNDLVSSTQPLFFETGLQAADAHGFGVGETFDLVLRDAKGRELVNETLSIPAGSLQDILNALNDPVTGAGAHGSFALDTDGRLAFTPNASNPTVEAHIINDETMRGGVGGMSISTLFGLNDQAQAGRSLNLAIRKDINSNPMLVSFASLDRDALPGDLGVGSGDSSGALALSALGQQSMSIPASGALPAMQATLADFAGRLAGDAGRRAQAADTTLRAAEAVSNEAEARRQSVEGVNLDEEMIMLSMYQQSYSANSRLIQAAKEMTDILLQM